MWTSIFGSIKGKVVEKSEPFILMDHECVYKLLWQEHLRRYFGLDQSDKLKTQTLHLSDNTGSTPFYSLHSFYIQTSD